ncbi:alpha-1,3-mannosyltransferase [Hoeflea marina]|uniref:Alpha-1,3-mannosyltransferase n=1 Tax=Hoeflea marina TaxID=274592 RepID=A0A317PGQ4_9HYPH|nr:alpha-1,3-mannosyltransferase [Hoeflea marina]
MLPAEAPLVVHVVRQYLPNRGGLEDVVANLCAELLGNGYRVRVVTLDRLFGAPGETLAAREIIAGVEVVRIPWRGSSRYPLAPSVFRHLRDADIVHVHAIDFFFDALAWGWPLHRRPMLVTTHGGFFHTRRFSRIKTVWFNTVSRISSLAYSRIICCSKADRRLFDAIAVRRTSLIENGADTGKFADAAAPAPTQGMITIGRFSANKQILRLLDAARVLVGRDPGWTLTIAGVASDLSEADVRSGIADRGLDANVRLVTGPSNADIRRMMAEASLFVSASDYEGFGLVAIEAMSAGLVPVLQPNSAYRDLAGRHDCIALADYRNPALAADAIEAAHLRLHSDFAGLRDATRAAAAGYGWPAVAGEYMAQYQAILGKGR